MGNSVDLYREGSIMPANSSDGLVGRGIKLLTTPEALGIDDLLNELAVLAACRKETNRLSCGIVLGPCGRPSTVACSDLLAVRLDVIQHLTGDGPGPTAMRTGQVAMVENTAVEDTADGCEWAEFKACAIAEGVGSSLSVPVTVGGSHVGALNLYAPGPGAFGENRLRRARGVATAVSGAVALAVSRAEHADVAAHLRAALDGRAVIDQALGIVMYQRRCTSGEAFGILRRTSQDRNVKLRELATSIVTSASGQRPQPPSFNNRSPGG
jgi:GAF domain-containing protein